MPDVVAGARPAIVERITIHGQALEGNLEADAVDRGRGAPAANAANDEAISAVKTPADSARLPFGARAQLASAAAWSPNPKNPPLYLDLPLGDNQQAVMATWAANAPLAFARGTVTGSGKRDPGERSSLHRAAWRVTSGSVTHFVSRPVT